MPYLTKQTRLTQKGEWVDIVNTNHSPVMIVRNKRGELHSVHISNLSDEQMVEIVVEIITEFNLFNQMK